MKTEPKKSKQAEEIAKLKKRITNLNRQLSGYKKIETDAMHRRWREAAERENEDYNDRHGIE